MSTGQKSADGVSAGGRGRLARVIAARGGLAAPAAPFVIEHREALIYMLCEAAELEHGTLRQLHLTRPITPRKPIMTTQQSTSQSGTAPVAGPGRDEPCGQRILRLSPALAGHQPAEVEFRHVRYVAVVAEELHFGRAAARDLTGVAAPGRTP